MKCLKKEPTNCSLLWIDGKEGLLCMGSYFNKKQCQEQIDKYKDCILRKDVEDLIQAFEQFDIVNHTNHYKNVIKIIREKLLEVK